MEDIRISNETNSIAFMNHKKLDIVYLCIPESIILDSETIKIFRSIEGWCEVKLINEILAVLEHESLHIVLDKIISIETSHKLDNPINGEFLEAIRDKDYQLLDV